MRVGADSVVSASWTPAWGIGMSGPQPKSRVAHVADLTACDDRALVDAFLAGRREAFDEIVARHQRQVYRLCFRFVGNHEDAADLAQDVFIRAFKGLGRFKGDASLGTWLYRVAVNVCLKRLALKRPATEPLDDVPRVDERAADPLAGVERAERSRALRRAIAQLPPRQRATVVLRIYQELSHEEIARVLDSSVGAVKANFSHAIGNLKRLVTLP